MRRSIYSAFWLFALASAAACGAPGSAQTTAGRTGPAGAPTAKAAPAANPCDRKLVGTADVAGIMTSPVVKMEPLEGDPQSCVFANALSGTITVTVRPGLGNVTVSGWEKGQMSVPATPMAGVGDRAVWQEMLNEVIATKDDVLCDISVVGAPGTAVKDARERVGHLCNTIYARQ